jgi:hypothetical protein
MPTLSTLVVKITADTAALQQGLNSAQNRLEAFNGGLRSFGTRFATVWGGLGAGVAILARFAQEGQALAMTSIRMSDSFGLATDTVAALQLAAERTGVGPERLGRILAQLTSRISDASAAWSSLSETLSNDVAGTAAAKFEHLDRSARVIQELGVDLQALTDPEERLTAVLEKLGQIGSLQERIRVATSLVGPRGAGELVRLSDRLGSGGLDKLKREASELGRSFGGMSELDFRKAEESLRRMDSAVKGMKENFALAVAPLVTAVANFGSTVAQGLGALGDHGMWHWLFTGEFEKASLADIQKLAADAKKRKEMLAAAENARRTAGLLDQGSTISKSLASPLDQLRLKAQELDQIRKAADEANLDAKNQEQLRRQIANLKAAQTGKPLSDAERKRRADFDKLHEQPGFTAEMSDKALFSTFQSLAHPLVHQQLSGFNLATSGAGVDAINRFQMQSRNSVPDLLQQMLAADKERGRLIAEVVPLLRKFLQDTKVVK